MNTVAFAPRTAHDVVGNIGNTPLLGLEKIAADFPGIEIYGKAEYFNPGGSVKDRPGLNMILAGERSGKLTRDKILIDATSGNTGIAYAMIGAAKGYRVRLCLPTNASMERKRILAAYGAELVLTPAEEGSDGAIRRVREIYSADPDKYFYPDQYNNEANWKAHFETTGPEIMAQTDGRITHFVTLLGTSGTFTGNARFFRKEMPHVECISAQPSTGFHGIEGTKHMPTAIVPGIYDPSLADRNIWIETEDCHKMVKRLAREEGILVGISSGGNVVAALTLARELHEKGRKAVIVTILCDGADKYLSEHFWDEDDAHSPQGLSSAKEDDARRPQGPSCANEDHAPQPPGSVVRERGPRAQAEGSVVRERGPRATGSRVRCPRKRIR